MSIELKLIHPRLGIVMEASVAGLTSEYNTINEWKHKYGKKFNECKVDRSIKGTPPKGEKRKFICIATEEVYDDMQKASDETGYSVSMIRQHLKRELQSGSHYYQFKYISVV